MASWHAGEVALIGYSFGADVMPFAYNCLLWATSRLLAVCLIGYALFGTWLALERKRQNSGRAQVSDLDQPSLFSCSDQARIRV